MSIKSKTGIKRTLKCLEEIFNIIRRPLKFRRFFADMRAYNKANTRREFHAELKHLYPCVKDWDAQAGSTSFYFWQDLWAAKKIFQAKPLEHFDIGSRLDGFIAHILTFMPVTMLDIRPLSEHIEGLKFIQADATNLEGIPDNSLISLSSLCAPEHFGLGRYNDPVDPEACFKSFKSMQRVLAPGGHLYISVPIGERNGVAFNAHRIFNPEIIISTLDELKLADFSMLNERYIEHADYKTLHGINYRGECVGFFEFVKE